MHMRYRGLIFIQSVILLQIGSTRADTDNFSGGFILPAEEPTTTEETTFMFGGGGQNIHSYRGELPPVGDQGRGSKSCMGWAVGYGLLSFLQQTPADARNAHYVYHWTRLNEMTDTDKPIEDLGCADFRSAFDAVSYNGSCALPEYSDFTQIPSKPVARNAKRYRAMKNFNRLSRTNINSIKIELDKGRVLPAGFKLYESFINQSAFVSQPHPMSGKMLPVWRSVPMLDPAKNIGHAMLVTGYDDYLQAFEVMNSFGDKWGDHGYIWIDYSFFTSPSCCVQLFTYDDSIEALVQEAGSIDALKKGIQAGDIEGFFKLGTFDTGTGKSETNFVLGDAANMDSLAKGMTVTVDPKMGRLRMRATLKTSDGVSPVLIGPNVGTLEANDRVSVSEVRKFVDTTKGKIEFWIKGRLIVD